MRAISEIPVWTAYVRAGALVLVLGVAACASTLDSPLGVVPPALFQKAAAQGSLPVIVRLRVTATSEDARRQAIRTVQEAVLREISGAPHRVRRRYETVPLMALEVSTDALRILELSRNVVAVEEDTLAAPQ